MPENSTLSNSLAVANISVPPINYQAELKPASSLKTVVTKVVGVLTFAGGVVNTAMGIYSMATGKHFYINAMKRHTPEVIKHISENQLKSYGRGLGGAQTAFGLLGMIVGNAEFGSAKAAERARNFASLQTQLDARVATAEGRGR